MKITWRRWEDDDEDTGYSILQIDGVDIYSVGSEKLKEARDAYFDRWNWETGSDGDRLVFEALDAEIERRKKRFQVNWSTSFHGDIHDEHFEAFAKEISDEIDKEILAEVMKEK